MKTINVDGQGGIVLINRTEESKCYYLNYDQQIQERSQKMVGIPILSLHLNTYKNQRDIDFLFDKRIYEIETKIKKDMLLDKENQQMYKFLQKDEYYEEGEQLHRQINVGYFVTDKKDEFKVNKVIVQPEGDKQ